MAPALLALAQFAPTIVRWIGGNKTSNAVTETIASVAKSVSGASSIEEAVNIFTSSQEKAYEFRLAMLEQDAKLEELYLRDMQDARARDRDFIKLGMTNARANFMFFLAVAIISGMVWIIWKDQSINEYVKGIFTLVLGRFLGYLDNIYNFEFGSTRASKEKDATITNLSKGE
ncbi:MAG: hypothetical protein AB7F19_07435 [Candidatus Babeliales bacterium]